MLINTIICFIFNISNSLVISMTPGPIVCSVGIRKTVEIVDYRTPIVGVGAVDQLTTCISALPVSSSQSVRLSLSDKRRGFRRSYCCRRRHRRGGCVWYPDQHYHHTSVLRFGCSRGLYSIWQSLRAGKGF